MSRTLSRRDFLGVLGGGIAAAAAPSLLAPARAAAATGLPAGIASFVSEPSLQPPTVTVSTLRSPSPGYLFVASLTGPGQRGPAILDNHGRVVWFRPVKTVAIDFRPQTYLGKPVLTWWEGTISQIGTGQGEGVIVDDRYREVARVKAGDGLAADVHEFLLTPQGTALITAYDEVQADLTSIGGSASAPTLDSVVQEVDVRTGKVLFEWRSLDHVPVADTYSPLLNPCDYFHVNSIDVDLDGSLIVSARNTSAIYKLDRKTGQTLWTLGGRRSDFQLGPRAFFMYQHDARAHPDGTLTMFDDGPSSSSQQSRGLRLGLDLGAMQANVLQEYVHPTPLAASAMGNAQVLPGDAVFVGWGTEPYFTEFGPAGDVRFDARFDGGAWNYRAFRDVWVGQPTTKPALAARPTGRDTTLYASWNGSTETRYWQVSTGADTASLRPVKTVAAVPFETAIWLAGRPARATVTALDAGRRPLATSRVLSLPA